MAFNMEQFEAAVDTARRMRGWLNVQVIHDGCDFLVRTDEELGFQEPPAGWLIVATVEECLRGDY